MTTRSTMLASRSMFNGDMGRCSAQVIVLGGLMALPGALITGLGSLNHSEIGEFYMLGPIMLSLGLLLILLGVIFKVLIMKGIIKPSTSNNQQRQRRNNGAQRDIPQSPYPWMTQPPTLASFPPPYTVEADGDGSSAQVVPLPPMYSPTSEMQPPGYVNEAFSPPAEPPPSYEEAERTKDKAETSQETGTLYIEAGTSHGEVVSHQEAGPEASHVHASDSNEQTETSDRDTGEIDETATT